ncbi:hypothetical protein GGR55DRAFT_627436 [Xylaria sp. FL0064]|nr:hypothetical protein GGR55DRAFT_627436 [Xylaria sp. FL0064]
MSNTLHQGSLLFLLIGIRGVCDHIYDVTRNLELTRYKYVPGANLALSILFFQPKLYIRGNPTASSVSHRFLYCFLLYFNN